MDAKVLIVTEDDILTLKWALRVLMLDLEDGTVRHHSCATDEKIKECYDIWTYLDAVLGA